MPQWDRRLYFPSEGRRAENFFALKIPTDSAGFETANLGTKGQHVTPRPPKPLRHFTAGAKLHPTALRIADNRSLSCRQQHGKPARISEARMIDWIW